MLTAFASFELEGMALLIKKIGEEEFNSFVKELIKKMVEHAQNR